MMHGTKYISGHNEQSSTRSLGIMGISDNETHSAQFKYSKF